MYEAELTIASGLYIKTQSSGLDASNAWNCILALSGRYLLEKSIKSAIFSESLSALISDVITLSNKLVKPLGIRVLPIPGKFPNDKTAFNHEFLSDMKVLKIQGSILPYIDF